MAAGAKLDKRPHQGSASTVVRQSLERIWPESERFVRQILGRDYTTFDFLEKIEKRFISKGEGLTETWLIDRLVSQVLRDVVHDERRAISRREARLVRDVPEDIPDPRQKFEEESASADLAAQIAQLPPDLCSFAAKLRGLKEEELGMERKELAKILGYRRNTLNQSIRRLRERLAKIAYNA